MRYGVAPSSKVLTQTTTTCTTTCLTNLPNVPTARTMRDFVNTQFLIRDALGVSDPMVLLALQMLGGGESSGVWVGATFDCVYGKPKVEVVRDLDGKYFVAGGGSSEALLDAALGEDDPQLKEGSFKEKKIATRLMTIVLHSFHSGLSVLVAIIPINEETGEIISACYFALRRLIFKHKSWLIWAGGDGAEQNQKAWKIVERKSKGEATTLLADVRQERRALPVRVRARVPKRQIPTTPPPLLLGGGNRLV